MNAIFQPQQAVWVTFDNRNDELGVVTRVGKGLNSSKVATNDLDHDFDKIEVILSLSGQKVIVDSSQLRALEDDTVIEGKRLRRSTRHRTITISSQNAPENSLLVTPSPERPSQYDRKKNNAKAKVELIKKEKKNASLKNIPNENDSARNEISPSESNSSEIYENLMDQSTSKLSVKTKRMKSNSEIVKTKPSKKIKSTESETMSNPQPLDDLKNEDTSIQIVKDDESEISKVDSFVGESDENDKDIFDRPFTVEKSSSGRATCRTCDEIIVKGELRVSHVPLFRGRPGYRVYRHLNCAVFSEDIHTIQDIGGWSKLSRKDLAILIARLEESKRLAEKEDEELEPDELVPTEFQGEIRQIPPGLSMTNLLPFQVEGSSWMYHQEYNIEELRGGILADEMGMGKTLQTIVTILDNRPLLQHCKPGAKHLSSAPDLAERKREEGLWAKALDEYKIEMKMNNVSSNLIMRNGAPRGGTLVICPLIALSQWKSEIEKFTFPGTLSVGIYHGTDRATEIPMAALQKYDIVLTTYQVLEQDFRKMVSPNKVSCPNCRAKFKIDKLRVHLKYFCGEGAQRTEAQARQRRANERESDRPSTKNGKSSNKIKENEKKKTFSQTTPKKVFKKSNSANLDFTQDDSLASPSSPRPRRSAAVTASKKLTSLENFANSDPDDSSFGSVNENDLESDDDSSSCSREPVVVTQKSDTRGNGSLQKAKIKQEQALRNAKGKKFTNDKNNGKKHKMKKFDDVDEDDEDDDDNFNTSDPLDGINLDELMDEAMAGSKRSALHSICWWRVVLDEAHYIKSRSSQTSAAAFALTCIHRWCLSGTPLQNRVGELYSLIRFLRIDPMAFYFCRQKGCGCKSIHYRIKLGKCLDCGHRSFTHFAHFNKHVLTPIQRDGYSGDGRRAMFKLKNEVLDRCLLRRTKETRAADMELPPRLVTIRYVRLHPVEEDFYQSLYMETKSSFDDYVQAGTLMNNYAHIFDLLTKMRQATNHPYMVIYTKKKGNYQAGHTSQIVSNGSVDCDMCNEPPTDRVVSSCCSSAFCRSCVIEYLTGAGGDKTQCPSCRALFTIDLNQASIEDIVDNAPLSMSINGDYSSSRTGIPSLKQLSNVSTGSILRRLNLAEFATSSKIEVLVQELIEMRSKRPGSKALVFSQFVNMLDLVRWRLHSDPCLNDLGLGVRILHGGMDVKSRDAALKDFREDNRCRVLLMSLKAAGVALNLTVASECFLLDLWWNPAAEMQAIDRTHRLGQYRPIRAIRFVAEGTVEERVLQLQEKKRLVFDGTVGRDAGSLKLLTVEDMKALFT